MITITLEESLVKSIISTIGPIIFYAFGIFFLLWYICSTDKDLVDTMMLGFSIILFILGTYLLLIIWHVVEVKTV